MSRVSLFPVLGWLVLLLSGCTTMDERAESIRARGDVLFEGRGMHGKILLSDRNIAWEMDGEVPVTVTPTTLHFGAHSIPISQIESVEIRDFDHAGELFVSPHTIKDLVIMEPVLADFWRGLVIRISDRGTGDADFVGKEAARLRDALETAKKNIDPFGRVRDPRPVWIGFCSGEVRALWEVEPRYLKTRFPGEDDKVMNSFRRAGDSSRAVHVTSMTRLLCEEADVKTDTYRFKDVGTLSLRGPRLPKPVRRCLDDRDTVPDCLVLVDVPLVLIQEKMDPFGNVSIRMRVRTSIRMLDLERNILGTELKDVLEVSVPIAELLQDDSAEVHAVMEMAARQSAGRLQAHFQGAGQQVNLVEP